MTTPLAAGDVVLLTGASAGIGEGVALRLAERGCRLALAARGAEDLERVAAACRARGGDAAAFVTDVADADACRRFVDDAVARFGRVDALVNNAGISMQVRFEDVTDLGVFERIMRVNYLGAVHCTHRALPHLRRASGRLAAVASLTALSGVPTRTAYAASKHAMRGFFDSLRVELADTGVTVTVAYPGFVATDIARRALGGDGRPIGARNVRDDEVMTVDECARLIVRALDRREREVVMTARGKLARWLKLVAPALVDRIAARAIREGR
jgi:NAD(P)-dependent dehydrogenase (short-subunit alcohol dehydrogenase family)